MIKPTSKLRLKILENHLEKSILKQIQYFSKLPNMSSFLNAVQNAVLVLNQKRQIVYANNKVLDLADVPEVELVYGLKPGDVWKCEHAMSSEKGCGSTEFCRTCGAAKVIRSSLRGIKKLSECRITKNESAEAIDLQVLGTPAEFEGKKYTIFSIQDISSEKRRNALEQIFFHDVLNTAGGIYGYAEILKDATPEEVMQYKDVFYLLTEKLISEIKTQRLLSAAENKELSLSLTKFNTHNFLEEMCTTYSNNHISKNKKVIVDVDSDKQEITCDKIILGRIISNMIKNALEECESGQVVTLGNRIVDGYTEFWVHNPGLIPRDIKLQIFKRSFSTKGLGKGTRYLQHEITWAKILKRVCFVHLY